MAGKLFETTIGEVCQVFDGPHSTPTRLDAGPVFLGITSLNKGRIDLSASDHVSEEDFAKWTRRVTPKPGDVVFSYETKLGEAAIIPKGLRCCLGRRMGLMRPDPTKLDSRFLLFYYLGPEFQEVIRERTIHGSTVERLALIEFPQFPLRIPPLAEQKAIAAVLGALDDKIELNRRTNATLEAMARALFQSWFVDFDPVRAKLDGRQPPGLDAATAALFPDCFEASEGGQVPVGWSVKRLPDAIEVNPRRTLKAGTVAPYLDMKNLPTQGHSADEVVNREFTSGTKFQNGDTLLARITPCLENGKTGYVDFLAANEVGWGSTEYIVLAPRPPLPPQFGYLLARSDTLRAHAIQNMTGTSGRQRVPSECFNTFLLVVPPVEIAHRFDSLTEPMMARIKANAEESRTLAALRDTLLPKLLSGEVRVPVDAGMVPESGRWQLDGKMGQGEGERPGSEENLPRTTQASDSNMVPFPGVIPARKTNDEFVEAVVIARLVKLLATPEYPLGRFRYNKLAYLAHRKVEDDTTRHYLKKAAGPYSPWAKYSGPEAIAKRNGYVRDANVNGRKGFLPAEKIEKIELYAEKYAVCAAVDWVAGLLRYRKNDDLEVLSTVDFAAVELAQNGDAVTLETVKRVIATNEEWAPKLNREIFSNENIASALVELAKIYPSLYKS